MIFDFVQLPRKVLSLDRKGKARELQSYLVAQYRSSKKSDLKRKGKKLQNVATNLTKCFFEDRSSKKTQQYLHAAVILSGV